mgnify:CR=1 FL=1|nr:MAG TPA: hypothetical protein [Caudoviricetes sp.]
MNKQDCVGINSWQEVERRLQAQNQIIGTGNNTIVRVNNSLNSFLNALVLNLKDILEDQSDISLWFFDIDEPTALTEPYISWETPNEHIGDFFYSRTKGVVYKYTLNGWEKNIDATLLKAMALTNTELVSGDNERKVFTTTPTPPYESGDWWIKEDGSLYVCQIGRKDTYSAQDFVTSVNYAGAVAEKTGNVLEVLKGTVITTTDNAVIYLDKATGTTSQISGDSIRTGIITSNNYSKNNLGMAINLNEGTIDTKNFKLDRNGNVNLYNGATVITDKGLMTNLQFVGVNLNYNLNGLFGNYWDGSGLASYWIIIHANIPANFIIQKAYIRIVEHPVYWNNLGVYGYVKDLAIYRMKSTDKLISNFQTEDDILDSMSSQINNVFPGNNSTWRPNAPSDSNHGAQIKDTVDLQSNISNSNCIFLLKSKYSTSINASNHSQIEAQNSCYVNATLNVLGYMNFN